MDDDLLAISALQHYAYCPRQFALIHIEQVWEENYFTAEGRRLHERVDAGATEQRRDVRYERAVMLLSQRHRISGKMDLLEVHKGNPPHYFPVEYKRGKPKLEDWDRIQLCAQALCIEEMRNVQVEEGALWYSEARHREVVRIDAALRGDTITTIEAAHKLRESGITPVPISDKKRCRACSLVDICQPDHFRSDRSARYVEEIFRDEEDS
jgi:CRISPR-associated exonuclease Cas4